MNPRFNILFKLGCLSMLVNVGMGARFGHKGALQQDGTMLFQKAQMYNITNALGFFAGSMISAPTIPLKIAAVGFVLGQILFISPLYYQSVKGRNSTLGKMMPLGGLAMMVAWVSLMFA